MLIDDDREPCISNFSLFCIITGLACAVFGLLYPVEPFYLDFSLSAEENEARQAEHQRTLNILYSLSAVGLSLMVFGGFISACLLCRVLLIEVCEKHPTEGLYHSDQPYNQFVSMPYFPGTKTEAPSATASNTTPHNSTQVPTTQDREGETNLNILTQPAQDYGSTTQRR